MVQRFGREEAYVEVDGREVIYTADDLDDLSLAYACTIHKSQGSEFPAVVVALSTQHHVLLGRNLLYTAITRARRLCLVVGSPRAMWRAVSTAGTNQRYTRLAARLRGEGGAREAMEPDAVTGVGLAGGKAERMDGYPKGRLTWQGRTLIAAAVDALDQVAGETRIVANDAGPYRDLGRPIHPDLHPGLGPIGGLETALAAASTPFVLVVACDMPDLSVPLLRGLRDRPEHFDAVVPLLGPHPEPLCARYAVRALPRVREQIAQGRRSLQTLLSVLQVERLTAEALALPAGTDSLPNINTPEDAVRHGVQKRNR